jgi:hypothetical protein
LKTVAAAMMSSTEAVIRAVLRSASTILLRSTARK